MHDGRVLAQMAMGRGARRTGAYGVRIVATVCVILAVLLLGFGLGRASDRDETSLTVQVSSADHEQEEGYFSLGENVTLLAKPGSDLFRFLTRQRGHKVKLLLQESTGPELSRIER
jgi:hypothetical protein